MTSRKRRILLFAFLLAAIMGWRPERRVPPVSAQLAPPEQQVLTVANSEPVYLDPQRASFASDIAIVKQMYRGLLYIDKTDPNRVIPAAAMFVPSTANGGVSADGKTYTLHLRSNLTWQDGSPLTASDFEYSIKRLFDPHLVADYASFYFNIVGSEAYYRSLGTLANPRNPSSDDLAALRNAIGLKAVDDLTLVITLQQPQPSFATLLTLWPADPVQKVQIDRFGDHAFAEAANIVGDGPFKLTEWSHMRQLTLEQNGTWWGDDRPILTKIVMQNLGDTEILPGYESGQLDLADIPLNFTDVVRNDPVLSAQNVRADQQTTFGLEFNTSRPPFDDVHVRRGFSEALDRDAFIKNVRKGIGTPAYSWLPPGVPGFDPQLGQQYGFDPDKARADLTASAYGTSLPPISLMYAGGGSAQLQGEFIQTQLQRNLGVTITLQPLESAAYRVRYQQNDFQMVVGGWGSDYADPEDWIPDLFGTGGGNNKTQYSNPRVDALIKQAEAEIDNDRRIDDYRQAHQMIVDDMPLVFLFYRQSNLLVRPYVTGLILTGLDGIHGDWFWTNIAISDAR
ncbi:MAG: peptide ABC transporter substrate-binding protein [Dehalococcoidia bacterium]